MRIIKSKLQRAYEKQQKSFLIFTNAKEDLIAVNEELENYIYDLAKQEEQIKAYQKKSSEMMTTNRNVIRNIEILLGVEDED